MPPRNPAFRINFKLLNLQNFALENFFIFPAARRYHASRTRRKSARLRRPRPGFGTGRSFVRRLWVMFFLRFFDSHAPGRGCLAPDPRAPFGLFFNITAWVRSFSPAPAPSSHPLRSRRGLKKISKILQPDKKTRGRGREGALGAALQSPGPCSWQPQLAAPGPLVL